MTSSDRFARWISALEIRHTRTLTTRELARAVQALSSTYVERRDRIASGSPLDSNGKRAAFALFYGPLHWLVVRHVVRELGAAEGHLEAVVDLGCGTGVAGAAWAAAFDRPPRLMGFDRSAWAVDEAAWTYRASGLDGSTTRRDVTRARLPRGRIAIVLAFTLNELGVDDRAAVVEAVIEASTAGARVLIVEPIARRLTPWWEACRQRVSDEGGRADEWRFPADLPDRVRLIGRSAGLDPREITAKTLYLDGRAQAATHPARRR